MGYDNVVLWISIAAMAGIVGYLSVKLPEIWRGDGAMSRRMEVNLAAFVGDRWAAAAVRSVPVTVAAVWLGLVSVVGGELGYSVVASVSAVVSVLFIVVAWSVWFMARPRFVVPPRFRR